MEQAVPNSMNSVSTGNHGLDISGMYRDPVTLLVFQVELAAKIREKARQQERYRLCGNETAA